MNDVLDSYIKTNFKLIDNEMGIACVVVGAAFAFLSSFVGIFLLLPLACVSVYFVYKGLRKLFYDSVYGPSASLFQALPVTPLQMVSGKIFTAGVFLLLLPAVIVAAGALMAALTGGGLGNFVDSLLQNFIDEGAATAQLPLILAAEFLLVVAASFKEASVVFYGVASYQSLPAHLKKWYMKILVIIEALAIQGFSVNAVDGLFTVAGLSYTVLRPLADACVQVAVLVILVKLTVKLVEKKYQL